MSTGKQLIKTKIIFYNIYIYTYTYIYYIYTIVNWKIKVPTGGIYTIYYPVAVINDIH